MINLVEFILSLLKKCYNNNNKLSLEASSFVLGYLPD